MHCLQAVFCTFSLFPSCNSPRFQANTHNATRFVFKLCAVRFPPFFHKNNGGTAASGHFGIRRAIAEVSIRTEVLFRTSDAEGWRWSESVLPDVPFLRTIAIRYLKDIGLLRSKVQCKTCGRDMTWSADSTHSEGFRWRCRIHSLLLLPTEATYNTHHPYVRLVGVIFF